MTRRRWFLVFLLAALAPQASAAERAAPAKLVAGGKVQDQYIVQLNLPAVNQLLGRVGLGDPVRSIIAQLPGAQLLHVYERALPGFALRLPASQLGLLRANPLVARVRQDTAFRAFDTPVGAWGTDRVDQRALPLDDDYREPEPGGRGVHVYVIDTGINPQHEEFDGRVGAGRNLVRGASGRIATDAWADCNGHGTHVAGVATGRRYGVAGRAIVHAVRVLDCEGGGTGADILAGIDWVLRNAQSPAVVNISAGTIGGRDPDVEAAVRALVTADIAVAVAAGNESRDACSISPAAEPAVLTVGATDSGDRRASFSNYGRCLDLFAPGRDIAAAWYQRNSGFAAMSGTSISTPHVAGALALLRSAAPRMSAAEAQRELLARATLDAVADPAGSPNRLLYVGASGPSGRAREPDPPRPEPARPPRRDDAPPPAPPPAGGAGCPGCTRVAGNLSAGQAALAPSPEGFDSAGGVLRAQLRAGAGTDFDLYLERYSVGGLLGLGAGWRAVASSEGAESTEDVAAEAPAGRYRWRINAHQGSARFELDFVGR